MEVCDEKAQSVGKLSQMEAWEQVLFGFWFRKNEADMVRIRCRHGIGRDDSKQVVQTKIGARHIDNKRQSHYAYEFSSFDGWLIVQDFYEEVKGQTFSNSQDFKIFVMKISSAITIFFSVEAQLISEALKEASTSRRAHCYSALIAIPNWYNKSQNLLSSVVH
ncbi:unnamed protein product [Lupinus luteus]|uniref:Uncharacterized protein n=1 Tax=Lupinus luteus TaxID=3873 RepID=A0AAV1WG91_LUPLU